MIERDGEEHVRRARGGLRHLRVVDANLGRSENVGARLVVGCRRLRVVRQDGRAALGVGDRALILDVGVRARERCVNRHLESDRHTVARVDRADGDGEGGLRRVDDAR